MITPFSVTVPGGVQYFIGQEMPRSMAMALQNANRKCFGRLVGSMDDENPLTGTKKMFSFFDTALKGIGGVLWSGGTRWLNQDQTIRHSVAEVVVRASKQNEGLLTMGSNPKVNSFLFKGEGIFTLENETDSFVNPETRLIATIQGDPDENDGCLSWDGDIEKYINFMSNAKKYLGLKPYAIMFGGGNISALEITNCHKAGFLIFIVEGSGRQADEKMKKASFFGPGIYHVGIDHPVALRDLLVKNHISK